MAVYDQLIIGTISSLEFDASVMARSISAPEKKEIKETIPFSNVTYDFSAINGEVYWKERELEYVFEIIAPSPEELETKKSLFSNWVMNVMSEEIHDPFEPEWHYVGTFSGIDYEDDESVEKTTITVTFDAYPYKIANNPTAYVIRVPAANEITEKIINASGHRLTPTFTASIPLRVTMDGVAYSMKAGETKDDSFKLPAGATDLLITNINRSDALLTIEFFREVF